MNGVVKLVVNHKPQPRACSTCRYHRRSMGVSDCRAVATYCRLARLSECNNGGMWEPRPSLVARVKLWIFGEG